MAPFYLQKQNDLKFEHRALMSEAAFKKKPEVEEAFKLVSENNLKETVTWLSSYEDRLHDGEHPNDHVNALRHKLEDLVRQSGRSARVDVISHLTTPQQTLRVHIDGARLPNEVVVLGGHLDSINSHDFFMKSAPGADDNASGSANILEALRVLLGQKPTDRTLEFFWYAGEEAGLLGSAEIARDYKTRKVNVVGVLQLDMTLFPGTGVFTLGSMTDFTSAPMRALLGNINSAYLGAQIREDQCGYGCSDHASWYRSGYPTVMPFESTFNDMNSHIHSRNDLIDRNSNFSHSSMFTKIAVAFAMHLGSAE
jgi:leucyl aminopeptidase